MAYSQQLIEKTGSEALKDDTPYFTSYIGSDQKYFYTLRVDKNIGGLYKGNYSVDQFDKNSLNYLKRIASRSGDTRTDDMPAPVMIKDKIYLLVKFQNKSAHTCDYALDIVDVKGKPVERRVLCSFPTDESLWYKTRFEHFISPDSSKIGVVARFKTEITYYIYDALTFKELGKKKLASAPEKESMEFYGYKMDNDGNLFYSSLDTKFIYVTKVPTGEGNALICTFKKTYRMGGIDLTFDSKSGLVYLHGAYYVPDKNPKAATYSDMGVFVAKIDQKTMKSVAEKYNAFSSEVMDKISCGKLEKGLSYRNYASMLFFSNSNLIIALEQIAGGATQRGTNPGSAMDMSSKVFYDANEIVVSSFTSDLALNWMKFIPRSNTYTNITNKTENSIASTYLFDGVKLNYYMIEHPKFALKFPDYASVNYCNVPLITTYPGSNVVEYSLDMSGRLDKRVLFTNKKEWMIPEFFDAGKGDGHKLVRFRRGDDEYFSLIKLR